MSRRWLLVTWCVLLLTGACAAPWCARTRPPAGPKPLAIPSATAARFLLNGQPVTGAVRLTARDQLRVAFSQPVRPAWVTPRLDGEAMPDDTLTWAADGRSALVGVGTLVPYRPAQLIVTGRDVATLGPIQLTLDPTVPANATTGVGPGFRPRTPLEIVVENSPPARAQAGLQDADIVYEYLSEYSVTRMTAIYFNRIPGLVGPVRSCRMINPYLGYAYAGVTLCTGVSNGTARYMFGAGPDARGVPSYLEPSDPGGHFFRVGFRAAPHNAYTSGDRAERVRSESPQPAGQYAVDPPHDDAVMGVPSDAPGVPLHSVSYAYDPASRQYLRLDHGAPFTDQDTNQQLHVKNVVMVHVPFHDAGWVEDENGGSHSVWYDMLGSGPAEIYADGAVVHATWHMGSPGQAYYDNHTPVWFTDEAGHAVLLDTGLTWIHVLGNGQDRCPDNVAAC